MTPAYEEEPPEPPIEATPLERDQAAMRWLAWHHRQSPATGPSGLGQQGRTVGDMADSFLPTHPVDHLSSASDGRCAKCATPLTPITTDDPRRGEVGELRCDDLTCPYSDRPQGAHYEVG